MPFASACPEIRNLERLVLGQIAGPEAEALEEHVARCDRCGVAVSRLKAEDPLVQAMRVPVPLVGEADRKLVQDLIAKLKVLSPPSHESSAEAGESPPSERSGADTPSPRGSLAGTDRVLEGCEFLEPPQGPEELGRLGAYAVVRVLGTGGMGIVFLARQTRPQRLVALKMILAGGRADRQRLARFRQEAEVLAQLQHPHIVQIYEVGDFEGRPYFAMEFVDGGNLAQKLAERPLATGAAAALVETLARTMQAAHERGFVHRDLKPSNVLLTAAGVPKIGDFGLAKQLHVEPGTPTAGGRTESGAILGTPSYMAPERQRAQQGDRPGRRRVLPGGDPVRNAHGPATVPRRGCPGNAGASAHPGAGVAQPAPAGIATRPGNHLSEMSGEGAGPTLRLGKRIGRRPWPLRSQ